jgi:hypothetical protein
MLDDLATQRPGTGPQARDSRRRDGMTRGWIQDQTGSLLSGKADQLAYGGTNPLCDLKQSSHSS